VDFYSKISRMSDDELVEVEQISPVLKNYSTPISEKPTAKKVALIGRHIHNYCIDITVAQLMAIDMQKIRTQNQVIWVDIECATEDDMEAIEEKFALHPLTVEEILNSDSRDKMEVFEDRKYIFFSVKELHYGAGSNHLDVDHLNIVIFSNIIFFYIPRLRLDFHEPDLAKLETNINRFLPFGEISANQ